MLWNFTPEAVRPEIEIALGRPPEHRGSFYPRTLPNLERCTEADFWGYHMTWSFDSDAIYMGDMELDGVRGTVRLYYVSKGRRANGGFAVLTKYEHGGKHSIHYFKWSACDHTFSSRRTGNCLHVYTCTKCGHAYEVDSSG